MFHRYYSFFVFMDKLNFLGLHIIFYKIIPTFIHIICILMELPLLQFYIKKEVLGNQYFRKILSQLSIFYNFLIFCFCKKSYSMPIGKEKKLLLLNKMVSNCIHYEQCSLGIDTMKLRQNRTTKAQKIQCSILFFSFYESVEFFYQVHKQ